jgi:hypothetical protein
MRPTVARKNRLYFTTAEGGQQKGAKARRSLAEPFATFLNAIIRGGKRTLRRRAIMLRACRGQIRYPRVGVEIHAKRGVASDGRDKTAKECAPADAVMIRLKTPARRP